MGPSNYYKPKASTNIAIGTTASAPAAVPVTTSGVVRMVATVDCYIKLNGTATTSNGLLLPAASPEYFVMPAADTISVITADGSSTGTLNISDMTK